MTLRRQSDNVTPLAEADVVTRSLFMGLARPILEAMKPGRAMFAKTIQEIATTGDLTTWVLKGLATVNLVERRGGYWRLTEWGEKARAGEAPPEGWAEGPALEGKDA